MFSIDKHAVLQNSHRIFLELMYSRTRKFPKFQTATIKCEARSRESIKYIYIFFIDNKIVSIDNVAEIVS